jgi:hypothetical protein
MKISPMVCLDDVVDTIQRCHHNVWPDHISFSNDSAVYNFGSESRSVSLCPLAALRCGLSADMVL